MENILILGSLPRGNPWRKRLYESMTATCRAYASNVSSPIDTEEFQGDRYKRAFQMVRDADLIIGEQSQPSTGQGMEIREAEYRERPLLVVARNGSKVSGLVKESPILREIIYYATIEDLQPQLERFLSGF